jgi:hypothetical protein
MQGNYLLSEIENQGGTWTKLGQLLRRYITPTLDQVAMAAGVSSTGEKPPPNPPQSVNVTTSGELMQIVVNHTAPIVRGARYFTNISTNPAGTNGIIHDHGASRAPAHIPLPTKTAAGVNHQYYVSSYVQYPGGPPSSPVHFGGGPTPTPVTMGGTTQMDIQPGTGSGTATNGGQAFQGLGKSPVRH